MRRAELQELIRRQFQAHGVPVTPSIEAAAINVAVAYGEHIRGREAAIQEAIDRARRPR